MKRICVYCGSSPGVRPDYATAATNLGKLLAERRIDLVYGGGGLGLMGLVANAVLAHGGHVIGVIPHALKTKEAVHPALPDLRVVAGMHERKALMAELADGFIALPGGFGTYEELCEVLTWSQLGFHHKPIGLLNTAGFYTSLLHFFDHATTEGFVRPGNRQLVLVEDTVAALLDRITAWPLSDGTSASRNPNGGMALI